MKERTEVQQHFRKLLEIIEEQRPGYTVILGEGLTDESIKSCITTHSIPESLIAIYSCVRGYSYERLNDFDFYTDLIPGYDLIEIYKVQNEINILQNVYNKLPTSWHWQPDMIPFLYDGAGDRYCVRTLPDNQSVVRIMRGSPDTTIICQSIKDFILIITECYKQNAYFLDEDGYPDIDYDLEEKIILEFNPNYYYQNDLEPK